MSITSLQRYQDAGQQLAINPDVLENATQAIAQIWSVNRDLFPLLTLNHLSVATDIKYGYLRSVVARQAGCYRQFAMRKRVPGRKNVRIISIPEKQLMRCQKWIVDNILSHVPAHRDSHAYHPRSNPIFAARRHVNAAWLIKVDIQDFFHAIAEFPVYRVFRSQGYSPLLSFELARICTMPTRQAFPKRPYVIEAYAAAFQGCLPQGAPTSPMLSNLVMRDIDVQLAALAKASNMRFTRYADDIVFSCPDRRSHAAVASTKAKILKILDKSGFRPNSRKTVIRGPGDRKIVLGMLVDGPRLRLPKDFKDALRLQLHYLRHPDFGPVKHAERKKCAVSTIYNHVLGLIHWARAVEPAYGAAVMNQFNAVEWPPISRRSYFDLDEEEE